MDSMMGSAANVNYVDFEPSTEVVQEKDSDTLLLNLPGFKKEQLRVHLTSSRILRISGSRPLGDNKVSRFQKEFPVSSNCDTRNITAKFESGILYIRQPKLITPEDQKTDEKSPPSEAATPQNKPADQAKAQENNVQQQASGKTTPADNPPKQNSSGNVPQKGNESTDLKNVEKKSAEEKTGSIVDSTKKTSFEGEKREEGSTKAAEKMDKGTNETADESAKTGVQKYKDSAVDGAAKLRMPRRVVNVTLFVVLALIVGLYVANFIRSFNGTENSE